MEMKKLYILVIAVGFSNAAQAQTVPKKAFYVGLGGSASVTNFSDQAIDAARRGLETRMSRPTTTVSGWSVVTSARPISRARAGVSSSGTIPRTS